MILDVLEQCFVMDKLGINKLEMHHPVKHVLIKKNKKVLMLIVFSTMWLYKQLSFKTLLLRIFYFHKGFNKTDSC